MLTPRAPRGDSWSRCLSWLQATIHEEPRSIWGFDMYNSLHVIGVIHKLNSKTSNLHDGVKAIPWDSYPNGVNMYFYASTTTHTWPEGRLNQNEDPICFLGVVLEFPPFLPQLDNLCETALDLKASTPLHVKWTFMLLRFKMWKETTL